MKFLSRPYLNFGAALLAVAAVAAAPPGAACQNGVTRILRQLNPLLSRTPGYLGVLVTDIDNDSVQKLRLKDNRGVIVTLIDHDAPAGPVLRVNDVVLSVNGEAIQGAEQFGRILKEIPAGKKVTLLISRDGAQQSITLQLVDHKEMEKQAWSTPKYDPLPPLPNGNNFVNPNADPSGWHMPLFASSLNVGALVEPLNAQAAEILEVPSGVGVLVRQVARRSEAELAGLRPKDVILKVGSESIKTTSDWDREIRTNEGKPVQITILRDRRQQTLTLQVDSKHHRSQSVWTDIVPQEPCPEMALLEPQLDPQQYPQFDFQLSQQQVDEMRRRMEEFQQQMEQFRQDFKPEDLKPENFKIDSKQMDEFRRQMKQFHRSFKDFKIDPKQMEEMRRQMEEFRKRLPQNFHFDRRQLDEIQREFDDQTV